MSPAASISSKKSRTGKSSVSRTISIAKVWSYCVKKIFKPQEPTASWVTFALWIISISIDPLIYYLPVINDEKKYLEINNKLVGLLFFILVVLQSCGFVVKYANLLTLCAFALQCLLVNAMISVDAAVFFIATYSFLVLYSWRVYGIYGLFTYKVTRTSAAEEAKTIMIKIVLNLVLYLYGGYVFGGMWYLFAIRKKTECWKKACKNHRGCHLDVNLGFIVTSGDTKFLNDNCPTVLKASELESYELGMFNDAFEFGIVESKNFLGKLLLCFRWGIQNLSGIGQNLPDSGHEAENIFVIFIIIYGVVMFTYFLGNVQMYIKYATKASEQRREMMREQQEAEIKKWTPFWKLSENLRNDILKNHKYKRIKTVHIKNLIKNVPQGIHNNIKRELCPELLRNVGKFERWGEASLFYLCDRVKPIIYNGGDYIVRERSCINFSRTSLVLQGKLCTFSSTCTTDHSTNNVPRDNRKDFLKDGDFWGEEFINKIQNDPPSFEGSVISNRTIIALTRVETFVLDTYHLRKLYQQKAMVIQSCFRKRRARLNRRYVQRSTQEQRLSQELPRPGIAFDQGSSSMQEIVVEGNSPVSEIVVEERHQ